MLYLIIFPDISQKLVLTIVRSQLLIWFSGHRQAHASAFLFDLLLFCQANKLYSTSLEIVNIKTVNFHTQ